LEEYYVLLKPMHCNLFVEVSISHYFFLEDMLLFMQKIPLFKIIDTV